MSLKLRLRPMDPVFYVPAAILLVLTSFGVTMLFATYAAPSMQVRAIALTNWISAAGLSAVVAISAYRLNRAVAFRSATIEAQKMLLEINKQYVAQPKLLYIEGEDVGPLPTDDEFDLRLKAMAYLKLNVFEVIFAVLPDGDERDTWLRYFALSLRKSNLLRDELTNNRTIYHTALIGAYDRWKESQHS